MSALVSVPLFCVDAAVVAASGWLLQRALQRAAIGALERGLGWLLACLLLVAGSAVMLGEVGGLGATGFLAVHVALLLLLLTLSRRKGRLAADRQAWVSFRADFFGCLRRPEGEGAALSVLLLVLALLALLAALSPPLVYDALTYRLPRIGQWLQDGRMGVLATDDARLNYMATGPDLVVAWLVGAWPEGFHLAPLAQSIGGFLLLGATLGLARMAGLSRLAALGAGALVLGSANVAPQFTSAHTDLFAAGVGTAAFYLLLCVLRRGDGSKLGGAGLAFALASKGTVFYLLPSLVLWLVVRAWPGRGTRRFWRRTVVGALLGGLIFLLPPFVRNLEAYGRLAAPTESMVQHYGPSFTLTQRLERLALNLRTSVVQLLDPHSQPWGWRAAAHDLAQRLAASLPEHDPYAFEGLDRRANLKFYLDAVRPNPDFAGPGAAMILLFLAGVLWACLRPGTAGAADIRLGAAGVLLFVLIQHGLLQWHPWTFRYLVLLAPWLTIGAVWLLGQLPGFLRAVLWLVLLVAGAGTLVEFTGSADQVGWQAWQTDRRQGALAQGWRSWARQVADDTPVLRLALPVDRPLAWFYRLDPPVRVRLAALSALPTGSAEAAVAGQEGWLIVPAQRYAGREGAVMASTWWYGAAADHDLRLAAYRPLRRGEIPVPVIYQSRTNAQPRAVRQEITLRSWQPRIRLELANPTEDPWEYAITTAAGSTCGNLPARSDQLAEIAVSASGLAEVTVEFLPPEKAAGALPAVVAVHPAGN